MESCQYCGETFRLTKGLSRHQADDGCATTAQRQRSAALQAEADAGYMRDDAGKVIPAGPVYDWGARRPAGLALHLQDDGSLVISVSSGARAARAGWSSYRILADRLAEAIIFARPIDIKRSGGARIPDIPESYPRGIWRYADAHGHTYLSVRFQEP